VLVRERVPGRVPALAEIREAVQRAWLAARPEALKEQLYQRLRALCRRRGTTAGRRRPGGRRSRTTMRRAALPGLAALLLLVAARAGEAHELRPGYLELRQTGPGTFAVLWKVPARGHFRLGIAPRFPAGCQRTTPPTGILTAGAFVERLTLTCAGGLDGQPIAIDGLSATLTDVLVRVVFADGATVTRLLRPGSPAFEVRRDAGPPLRAYLGLGVTHILLGIDHLLFVLGLLVLVRRRLGLMVKTVTAFTVAHSLTLAATTLGIVRLPAAPVDAVIALSILFLGVEIARQQAGGTSLTIRHPWGAAFGFGLLHGFGFASGLSTLGLPASEVVLALLLFNAGVELGQLGIIALYLALRRPLGQLEIEPPRPTGAAPAYVVGALGAYWTLARTAGLAGPGG
jgi:hypothetical protein